MPEANVETIRRITDHFNANGELGPADAFDPEVTFRTRGDVGSPQTYHGHEGLREAHADFGEAWSEIEVEPIELIDADDVLVAVFRFRVRSQAGLDLEIEEGWSYWFRDGGIARIEQHGTKQNALAAAGLADPT